MSDLRDILEMLRRQRRDLEDLTNSTSSRPDETASLLEKIDDLRKRSEENQRRFEETAVHRKPRK